MKTRQLGFYSKLGRTIWEEPRGTRAGYAWPQYSVHRGELQMMLFRALMARAGPGCLSTGARATGYETTSGGATLLLKDGRRDGGRLVVGADGIHSALRAQMVPGEGAPVWSGRILWRATTRAPDFKGGAAMAMIGHDHLRLVAYPISEPDGTGRATMNWIAEKSFDPSSHWRKEDWNRAADITEFLPDFDDWCFDWIDVPALIRGAGAVYEYPMVDRDPLEQWTAGNVTLMGDAAHPTYPVGSNGASQAIVDARVIGAKLLEHGVNAAAFQAYEAEVRPLTKAVGLANRAGSGPDGVLQTDRGAVRRRLQGHQQSDPAGRAGGTCRQVQIHCRLLYRRAERAPADHPGRCLRQLRHAHGQMRVKDGTAAVLQARFTLEAQMAGHTLKLAR